MGKKRFNAKARQHVNIEVDNSLAKKIQIEINDDHNQFGGYDKANALVLPSEKRKTKVKTKPQEVIRILSKKQRKRLEKIVDKKKKKEGRAALLENLASVQISNDELKQYISISAVQTAGIKNFQKTVDSQEKSTAKREKHHRVSSVAGVNRKRRLALLDGHNEAVSSDEDRREKKARDMNIISTEIESSDDSEIEEDDQASKGETEGSANLPTCSFTPQEEVVNNRDALKEDMVALPSTSSTYIHLYRHPDIQAARLKLPILAEEQQIMETIRENPIVIIAGETGSGKTTQIPQFLYEAGYAQNKLIGITEPRRVAAISMSKRVAHEMNLSDRVVSFLIRFEGNVSEETKIKFMTDGVLLKEIESDFLLSRYSVIILDEAHERSAYTDILVGLLSRIVPLRHKRGNPLKLIIMSATLKVEDFTCNRILFKSPPPVLKVEARQFPVTIHFQKHTDEEYVKAAYKKTIKIHSKLPEGGILIFVTGQQEVNYIVRKLRNAFPYKGELKSEEQAAHTSVSGSGFDQNIDDDEFDIKRAIKSVKKSKRKLASQVILPKINLDNYKLPTEDTDADLLDDNSLLEESDLESEGDEDLDSENLSITKQPLWVLPLYSLLSSEKQKRVFDPPPNGCRLCVVSTNVAETSLTIPNIKYVVDSGRQKTRLYDKLTGVSAFVVSFTSKASANQRAGRAGRVSPGHCYRLYSSAVFNDEFESFSMPDIQKKPVDGLVLQMKCMGIDKVINFPFPSPPDRVQLEMAEKRLKLLGALEDTKLKCKDDQFISKVTPLGHAISAFPVAPRFGKMLALSHQQNLLPYVVCMVAALSVQEILSEVSFHGEQNSGLSKNPQWSRKRQLWARTGNYQLLGDPMVLLRAVGAAEYAGSQGKLQSFCDENGLRHKAITEIRKLRVQLTNEINLSITDVDLSVDPKMEPPSDQQAKFLRQILLAGMGDQVARKIPNDELKDKDVKRKFKNAYQCSELEDPVFMHSSSVLKKSQPEWVIYQEVFQLQDGDVRKMFMRGITAIEPEWLLVFAPKLCNIKIVREDPPPKYNINDGKIYCYVDASFGRCGWDLPLTETEMPLSERACKFFGKFLLEGVVFPKLAIYKSKLKSSPNSIIKSWSNLNPFITNFSKALLNKQINNRQKMLDAWESEPTYLLQEYADLLYDCDCSELSLIWPPLNA